MKAQVIYVGGLTHHYDNVKGVELKPGGDFVIRLRKNESVHTPSQGVAIVKLDDACRITTLTLRPVHP